MTDQVRALDLREKIVQIGDRMVDLNCRRRQAMRETPRRIVLLAAAVATISGAVAGVIGYTVGYTLGRTPPPIVIQVPSR